jgi:hypothetical protein
MLFETRAEAETAKAFIDNTGCGGSCIGNHSVEMIAENEHLPASYRERLEKTHG